MAVFRVRASWAGGARRNRTRQLAAGPAGAHSGRAPRGSPNPGRWRQRCLEACTSSRPRRLAAPRASVSSSGEWGEEIILPFKARKYFAHHKLPTELLIFVGELCQDREMPGGTGGRRPGLAWGDLKSAWNVFVLPAEVLFKGAVAGALWPEHEPLAEAGLCPAPASVPRSADWYPEPPRLPGFLDTLISRSLASRLCSLELTPGGSNLGH